MRLAIVIPTFQRTRKLQRCIVSIQKGTFKNWKIFVYCDNFDRRTYDFLCVQYRRDHRIIPLLVTKHLYVIGCWNDFSSNRFNLNSFQWDAMGWIVDDVELDKQCLDQATSLMKSKFLDTDGIIGITQHYPGHPEVKWRENGQCLIGRKFVERFVNRQVCCPDYIHFYQDEEVLKYAKSVEKFALCKTAFLIHHHPAFYPNEYDTTHEIVRGEVYRKDTQTYRLRKQRGLIWGKTWKLVNV